MFTCIDLPVFATANELFCELALMRYGELPKYFMLLDWAGDKVATIRDFRYATYVVDGAEYRV